LLKNSSKFSMPIWKLSRSSPEVRLRGKRHAWETFQLEGLSGAAAAEQSGLKVANVFMAKSNVQNMIHEELAKLEGPVAL
jgi:RNA polymerase sigma-70 factor (ECF subfamily)